MAQRGYRSQETSLLPITRTILNLRPMQSVRAAMPSKFEAIFSRIILLHYNKWWYNASVLATQEPAMTAEEREHADLVSIPVIKGPNTRYE